MIVAPTEQDPEEQIQNLLAESYKEKMRELAKMPYYEISGKKYRRHKITVQDFEKAKEMIAAFSDAESEEQEIDAVFEFYRFLALCYLRMTPDEFETSDWGLVKLILDACQYRTAHSLADFSKALYEYFHLERARLNEDELEQLKMYRLWTGKAKTKPWEVNGGFVYQEDINALLKLEELEISGKNFRAKKEQARASLKAGEGGVTVGEDGDVHKKSTRIMNSRGGGRRR